jgi:hypothetical protein
VSAGDNYYLVHGRVEACVASSWCVQRAVECAATLLKWFSGVFDCSIWLDSVATLHQVAG